MKCIVRHLLLLFCMLCSNLAFGQTYNISVGETLRLNVPSVTMGYVDKAIWACSNPAITFVSKSEVSATVKAVKSFNGYATVELVYVERYVDNKGFTRANTYRKNFYVSCIGGSSDTPSSNATSIYIQPELSVEIGKKVEIPYKIYPLGSTAEVFVEVYPGVFFSGITNNLQKQSISGWGRNVGIDEVTVYFYDEKEKKISSTCKVSVYDPTWILPQSISLPSVLLLSKGEQYKLLPTLYPSKATAIYEWKSDDYAVASILKGTVTARGLGNTDITVTTNNGLTTKCTVIVIDEKIKVKGMTGAMNRAAEILEIADENIR